jgi:peptidyl-prolyl cis-trans isomerase D
MLQDIRQQTQGTTAKIIVGLIVVSFAFFGIESILVSGGSNEVAEVNGESIYPQDLQQALETQKRRLITMVGNEIDPAMLDDERLRPQALESLINRKLLTQSAQTLGLTISESEIGRVVASMEQFQVDGTFSPDMYKSVLSSLGYTPSYFKMSLRDDMVLNQLGSGLAGSEFVTPSELEVNTRVASEQRDLRYLVIPRDSFVSPETFSDTQIETFYAAHEDEFRSPESVDIEYLELKLDDFRKPVEESAILEAFELAKADSQFQTQNRVSHILFEASEEHDEKARLAKAQEELAAGTAFSEVARKYSDDVGSADKGGDLGYTSGQTFPEALEVAISELEPGIVSAPIETDAGTHLVVVTERKQAGEPKLDEMREQLHETIQTDEARAALLREVESLRDLSFNSEDLSYPAKELNLSIQQAKAVPRSLNEGLFSNSALIEAAFSDDVLTAGNNSEVIELPGDQFVVLRVAKHNQSEVKPLESVKEQVVSLLQEKRSADAVIAKAETLLERLRAGQPLEEVSSTEGYEMRVELGVNRRNSTVPPEVLQRVFELPQPNIDQAIADFVIASNGDAIVVELLRVVAGEYKSLPATEQLQLRQLLSGEFRGLTNIEFQRGIREQAEVSVL